jgi:hypothetical protein
MLPLRHRMSSPLGAGTGAIGPGERCIRGWWYLLDPLSRQASATLLLEVCDHLLPNVGVQPKQGTGVPRAEIDPEPDLPTSNVSDAQ